MTRSGPGTTLFARLRDACAADWTAYTAHAFVRRLADGTLPEVCFRHYLVQDYLFLIHFARAYGLAAFKSETLDDLRHAAGGLNAIVDTEIGLHVGYCARWGLTENDMARAPEAAATMAFTRYVLERGLAGDLLDLQPPTPSWGNLLTNAQELIWQAPALAFYPGTLIFVTVIAFNFLGDGLRDALDPRALDRRG